MEDIKLVYENYEEIVLINYFTSNIIKKNNETGIFSFNNDILKIIWNNKKEELFIKDNKVIDDLYYSYIYINIQEQIKEPQKETTLLLNENLSKEQELFDEKINIKKINIFLNNNVNIFIFDEDNNKIINYENNTLIFDIIFKYSDNILLIKINNDYYSIFEIIDNIYYDNTEKYNIKLEIKHNTWNDFVIINKFNNFLYRLSNNDENATFKFDGDDENKLIIYWKKWDSEYFIKKNNIYQIINEEIKEQEKEQIKKQIKEEQEQKEEKIKEQQQKEEIKKEKKLNIFHTQWNEECIIDEIYIYRNNNKDDYGNYEIKNNILEISWKLWNKELFI